MNMRPITLAVGITILAATVSSFGQVIIRGTQSSDQSSGNSASSSAVTIDTGDRNVVPLIKETKDTKVDATTQRTESVTRARLDDGSYFEWQRSTTVKKDVAPGQSVSSTDVVEKDRQGQSRVSQHADTTVSKSASGETDQTKVYKRDSGGQLVLDHVVVANTVNGTGGAANTTSVEKTADVNGNLSLLKQVDSVAADHGPNEKVITAETKAVDHLSGQLAVTAQETTSITTQGGVKQTDSVVRTPDDSVGRRPRVPPRLGRRHGWLGQPRDDRGRTVGLLDEEPATPCWSHWFRKPRLSTMKFTIPMARPSCNGMCFTAM